MALTSDLVEPKMIKIWQEYIEQSLGTPQGGKNAPRFFNEYLDTCLTIFDIKYRTHLTKGLIADDLILFYNDSGGNQMLEQVRRLRAHTAEWNLEFNTDKTNPIPLNQ